MTNVSDLHIEKDIVPLFDYTNNKYAQDVLYNIFKTPLHSVETIIERQNILKGFIANINHIGKLSYSSADFYEVQQFISNHSSISSEVDFRLHLLFSKTVKLNWQGNCIRFVLFYHKLQKQIEPINDSHFPASYRTEIQAIKCFLAEFNLDHYEKAIKEDRFTISKIISLIVSINSKIARSEFDFFLQLFYRFEAYYSISLTIHKRGFTFPAFSDTVFSFEQLYHPLLKQPVKNNVTINAHVVMLTGANMSGKSTLLKALGLSIYLAHIGIGVAAKKATIPFFDQISVFINLQDNLLDGYSHFMTEIMQLKNVAQESKNGKKCFAIFDELFRGTNIDDAIEISTTTIKGLTKFNGHFIVSTHLHQLQTLDEIAANKVETYYIDCTLQDGIPVFTYQLKEGSSNIKIGKLLFEKEGLNEMLA